MLLMELLKLMTYQPATLYRLGLRTVSHNIAHGEIFHNRVLPLVLTYGKNYDVRNLLITLKSFAQRHRIYQQLCLPRKIEDDLHLHIAYDLFLKVYALTRLSLLR